MIFNPAVTDYQKDGDWKEYDEKGKVTPQKWVKGEEVTNQSIPIYAVKFISERHCETRIFAGHALTTYTHTQTLRKLLM